MCHRFSSMFIALHYGAVPGKETTHERCCMNFGSTSELLLVAGINFWSSICALPSMLRPPMLKFLLPPFWPTSYSSSFPLCSSLTWNDMSTFCCCTLFLAPNQASGAFRYLTRV
ncbi:hypothetical protein MPTK1_2g11600 [Marchantia polymorpha subsp. ruderalis]|uniref:Uncharacterized protein n=1 Tax=Marchantia polymorpha TaxID=3197 RepID=A0A2R6XCI6_MARPO|nr:hypothetical protein MARPO_0023s0126 [Marchantia polymorpha]BBN01961.1 hypothetical protein Mp_2g11600 [Marchantia polymorpha subsp. ruderalis]|eukprot:PTQ43823.1 hypothetical protein MARPO_0023s0126 [Marchantia polymorpha]